MEACQFCMGKIMNLGGTALRQIYFESQMQPFNSDQRIQGVGVTIAIETL